MTSSWPGGTIEEDLGRARTGLVRLLRAGSEVLECDEGCITAIESCLEDVWAQEKRERELRPRDAAWKR